MLQVFNLSVLPGTAFRQTAVELGLEYQPRPPYYVLKTPTLELDDLYMLMEEAQDVFGIIFDALPTADEVYAELCRERTLLRSPVDTWRSQADTQGSGGAAIWNAAEGVPYRSCILDLDDPAPPLPPVAARSHAFTLWLKSCDFRARAGEAIAIVRQILADNPHTTLQIVLEPLGDPRHLTAELLEDFLAACHESLSYLDWFYSLHPVRLLGAKRLVVIIPEGVEESPDASWLDAIEDRATIVRGGYEAAEALV